MNKRVVGVVALLSCAFAATSRPGLAQDADDGWFDESAPQAAPAPAPSQVPAAQPPQMQRPVPQTGPNMPVQIDNTPETDPTAITQFRSTLQPYGSWVDDAKYGTVWIPNRDVVGPDFAPYVSAGHWALTVDGDWIWQSDYPFGGVVFHYGRWVWVPGTGWAWVAGRQYANAWVSWRVPTGSYGYIGWAPMPPTWGWYGGYAVSLGWYPPYAYVFCPSRYAFSYRVHTHIVRDHYGVREAARNTQVYPGSGVQRVAASPRPAVGGAGTPAPRGPTLESARVPAGAAPSSRVPSRMAAFSGDRSPSIVNADGGRRYDSAGMPAPRMPASPTRTFDRSADYNYRAPTYVSPSSAPRPSYTAPVTSGYRYSPSQPRTYTYPSARQYDAAPATRYSPPRDYSIRPAPSFDSSPSFHSAPSAPSFHSMPTPSFSGGRR